MISKSLALALLIGVGAAQAGSSTLDAAIGGGLGGAAGAAIGNEVGGREGAILGGALGAAVGTAVTTDDKGHAPPRRVHHEEHYRYRYRDDDDYHYHPGRFCPPGQAKKGRC